MHLWIFEHVPAALHSSEISIHYTMSSSSTNISTICFSVRLPWTLNSFRCSNTRGVGFSILDILNPSKEGQVQNLQTHKSRCRLNGPHRSKTHVWMDKMVHIWIYLPKTSICYTINVQFVEHLCNRSSKKLFVTMKRCERCEKSFVCDANF